MARLASNLLDLLLAYFCKHGLVQHCTHHTVDDYTIDASVKSDRDISNVSSTPLLIRNPSAISMSSGVVTW